MTADSKRTVPGLACNMASRCVYAACRNLVRASYSVGHTRYCSTKEQTGNVLMQELSEEEPHVPDVDRLSDQFFGAGSIPFSEEIASKLMAPVNENDVEIKPEGLIYLPEIKYRRILNKAFGPGGWALIPRGESLQFQSDKDNSQLIVREYALYCLGRFVAQTVGEHTFFSGNMVYGRAMEAAKSNALMRCCKDLGVSSELWDPQFVIQWKEKYAMASWCENQRTGEKKKLWRRKDRKPTDAFSYPWKET